MGALRYICIIKLLLDTCILSLLIHQQSCCLQVLFVVHKRLQYQGEWSLSGIHVQLTYNQQIMTSGNLARPLDLRMRFALKFSCIF